MKKMSETTAIALAAVGSILTYSTIVCIGVLGGSYAASAVYDKIYEEWRSRNNGD